MRFEMEQRFSASVVDVESAYLDPNLLARLGELPHLGRPELLDQDDDGERVCQRVRYRFTGHLAPGVTAVVNPDRLTWVQESVLDRRTHSAQFTVHPDHYADRLRCTGTIELMEEDGGTRRRTEADLRVRFPLVGPRVERAIVEGLRDHNRAEEEVVQAWLDERGGGVGYGDRR